MQERMLVEHLSESTITTYIHFAKRLIDYHGILPRGISTEQIYEFLSELRVKQGLSNSTIKQAVGSIKYLYRHILNIPKRVEGIPYPRQEKHLPEILTGKEIKRMFDNTKNIKHRAMLMLVYSTGIRRSEARTIRLTDIDRKNMQIHIRQGKGRKDRYVILSKYILRILEQYFREYRPERYIFNGRKKGERISESAMRWALDQALKRVKITKDITIHSLRHSFASHLLSMGTNLFVIQQLLGHESIKTTMIYLQINYQKTDSPVSPLDVIYP